MKIWHRNLRNKFKKYSTENQLLMICNELNRANNNLEIEKEYKNSLERSLELFYFLIEDEKWSGRLKEILRARDLVAALYIKDKQIKTEFLQKQIIMLNSNAWKLMKGYYNR
ncbi:MAG: hypothetical protein U9Q27_02760 [Patescibacteria group bacterium]|nr:hypothetical protein [Patescibacteria group bacterium]MEA3500887.1 hypothetical protein [Candidatus Neomarinimicrobiota bacterium]